MCLRTEERDCLFVCIRVGFVVRVGADELKLIFIEVSRVNLEEQIAAWMLFEGVLYIRDSAGRLQQITALKIRGQVLFNLVSCPFL